MSEHGRERLYELYQEELDFFRKFSHEFSKTYPKAAAFLELGNIGSYDPHVERLIEAFAFLSARVQCDLDEQFPEIITALLDVIYPHFSRPIPAMTILHLAVDPVLCDSVEGYEVKKDSIFFSQSHEGYVCEFRTQYPIQLWPIEIMELTLSGAEAYPFLYERTNILSTFKMKLNAHFHPFNLLKIPSLRFYINLADLQANQLYELLFQGTVELYLLDQNDQPVTKLPKSVLRPVGFDREEVVIPCPAHALRAYNLITEYFCFERKFLFFDLELPDLKGFDRELTVLILLGDINEKLKIRKNSLLLGCTPAVNLFERKSDPLRIDHKKLDYMLSVDMEHESHVEIYSVTAVNAIDSDGKTYTVEPMYDHSQFYPEQQAPFYWQSKRTPSLHSHRIGTDISLAFLDKKMDPNVPLGHIVYVDTICTNRYITNQISENEKFRSKERLPIQHATCVVKPTQKLQPNLRGESCWRLLSVLSFNRLSLFAQQDDAVKVLHSILRVLSYVNRESAAKAITGIRSIEMSPVIKRVGEDAWRGFCRGTRVTLTFDPEAYSNSTPFLFSAVLERFFSHLTHINSFTELHMKTVKRKEVLHRWPPRTGDQALI
ncbi:MAG: hypothetical protein A3J38_09425 [Gammaproteobacteria bacterium RIFCSPHIGHO2_12_FULL_45_9]|nr:MAG: hypothetical protein A3J38_09425 [Gammaproteobacteria bacterium RIFCSPHIGHO2_12_FULL_45_9]